MDPQRGSRARRGESRPDRLSEREFQKVEGLRFVCGPCRGRDLKFLVSEQNSLTGWRFIGHVHRPLIVNGERDAAISPIQTKDRDRGSPTIVSPFPGLKSGASFTPNSASLPSKYAATS